MKFNFKRLIFAVSLIFNVLIILLIVFSSFQKNSKIICTFTDDGFVTAAEIVTFPKNGKATFENLGLSLKRGQKTFLQFSILSDQKQSNMLINALYDPDIIKVVNTGLGIEIIALNEGTTLMQMVTNNGIQNVAVITVEE